MTNPADAMTDVRPLVDRWDAGLRLAGLLPALRGQDELVLGIALGGVPVAAQVARLLGPELDVVVARKIGVPFQPELALGAVTADGDRFTNLALLRELKLSTWLLRVLADEQRAEARLSEERLRGHRPPPRITGRTEIVVDDGLATGATMRAALRSVDRGGPSRVVVAAPVVARSTAQALWGGSGRGDLHPGTRPVLRRGAVSRALRAGLGRRGPPTPGGGIPFRPSRRMSRWC